MTLEYEIALEWGQTVYLFAILSGEFLTIVVE